MSEVDVWMLRNDLIDAIADRIEEGVQDRIDSRELGKQIIKAIDDVLKPLAAKPDAKVGEGEGA